MYDFFRAACAVPNVIVGDADSNTDEIIKKAEEAAGKNADITVFPELCITGYTCADLFFQNALSEAVKRSIKRIAKENKKHSNTIVVGAPLKINGQLYNCAVIMVCGKVCGIVPKTFLPVYNEYYEKRWFSSSEDLSVKSVFSSEIGIDEQYDIPIGRDLVFSIADEVKLGVEICEDLWAPIAPSSFLAVNGAELIVNLSASNETIAKRPYRRELVSQQSARNLCAYVYSSAGSAESTTDVVFSGHSLITENGSILCENESFIDSGYIIVKDIDIGKIRADRMKNKSFKDTASIYGKYQPVRSVYTPGYTVKGDGTLYNIKKLPFVPYSKKDRIERCMNIFEMQVAGLKKRLSAAGGKLVIGVSGGLDSTLALLVAAQTARQSGKPSKDVIGITMPCFGTSDRTYNNSLELMKTLEVTSVEINIKEACIKHFEDIGHDPNKLDLTYENSQARERTQVLMDYAGKVGGFVVGTGDLSELALGWCTYNADHMSMYGVNASIPKTLVRWMIDSIVEYNIFPKSTEVLKDIIDTPISPELLPPDETGNIAQKTESIIGPYALHDFFLYNILRFGFSPSKIYYLAKLAFDGNFNNETILKWLKNFYKRFFSQQFKRSCLPDGVKIGSVCLSPRGDWRMPSDASAAVWLKEADSLK